MTGLRQRYTPEMLRLDKEFLQWIRRQKSCLSGSFEYWENGEGRCIAAHVRTAKDAGTGFKPLFSAVPLLDSEHRNTHQHGDGFYHPKAWWVERAADYLARWQEETGITSLQNI
jgi:hypothetical protein